MEAKQIPGVPVQKKGAFHDTESKRSFESEEHVANHFEILKDRFFPSIGGKSMVGIYPQISGYSIALDLMWKGCPEKEIISGLIFPVLEISKPKAMIG